MSRGRISVIRDPAIAAAAAKCWMARWNGGRAGRMLGLAVNSFHPSECGFCDFPADRLVEAVDEFNTWAGLKPPQFVGEPVAVREAVETFMSLPEHEQKRLVAKAQGYGSGDGDEEDL